MIWCVEDDPSIRDIEVYALNSTGLEARGFEDGSAFWEALQHKQPDLVLLDVMLPGVDGLELLARLKASERFRDLPVIMATAKGSEFDKVRSLDMGADDYITKPFGMMEMVSRVKAVLRRTQPKQEVGLLQLDELTVNPEQHTVSLAGQRIALTNKEFALLKLFLSQPGTAFTRDQLLQKIWNTDYVAETRTVDMHIRTLRQKLGSYGHLIETVRGVGYRLEVGHDT
ncbi:MAG: response regulator [Faecousia sp.]